MVGSVRRSTRRGAAAAGIAITLLLALVALPAPPPSAAAGSAPPGDGALLRGDEERPERLEPLMPVPDEARARYFHVDAEAFAAAATGAPTGDDEWRDPTSTCRSLAPRDLELEVFDGRTVAVEGVRASHCTLDPTPVEGVDATEIGPRAEVTSWIGQAKVDGSVLVSASFVVVRTDGAPTVLIGRIDDADGHHVVQPVAEDGLTVLYQAPDVQIREDGFEELNRQDEPSEGEATGTPRATEDDPAPSGWPESGEQPLEPTWQPAGNADATRTIRIGVVHANGVSATDATWHAASGANDTNASLLNSQVPVEVEIAGAVVHANFNQTSSMANDLLAFRFPNDGVLEEIHLVRPARAADLGMLVLPGPAPGTCAGVAWVPKGVEVSGKDSFSAQDVYGCNNTVMAHEVGHNMGSYHDPATSHAPGDPLPDSPFTYSYGHYVSTKGRDNMASVTHCAAPCPTKPQYADPDIDLIGFPGHPSGTQRRRGADSIRLTSWSLSQIYPSTSNDHMWLFGPNRAHSSTNVEASTGADPEAPYTPFGGRFTGTKSSIFWYFPDVPLDRITVYGSGPSTPSQTFRSVLDTYLPAVGDFDGDGREDIFWHGPGAIGDSVWWGQGGPTWMGLAQTITSFSVSGSYRPAAGDFDGDGSDDVLWYSPTGQDRIWWGGASFGSSSSLVAAGPNLLPVTGDFDGDGRDDVLWYGRGSTPDTIWWGQPVRSNLGTWATTSSRTIVGTYLPAAGDFDADGRDDIVMYGPGTGADYLWWGHPSRSSFGPGSQTVTTVSGQYTTPVPGDYDSDGRDDLYWFAYG